MKEKVFWDTWAFDALFNSKDQWHREAVRIFEQYNLSNSVKITSDFILDETLTSLSVLIGPFDACEIVEDYILPSFEIIEVSKPVFRKALNLRKKYPEKPDISFTDFTSLALMLEENIQFIFTGDLQHFKRYFEKLFPIVVL